jgi:trimeric autotransporter adhesin
VNAALPWDPDGAGPQGQVIVVAGAFQAAGTAAAAGVATWDPATSAWSALGEGWQWGEATALAVLPNGDLIVAGSFVYAGSTSVMRVARWSGSAWLPLGGGMNGTVSDLAVLPNGELVAVGEFSTAGGLMASHVARWNGTAWSPMGPGLDGPAYTAAVLPNGDLVVGGAFLNAGGSPASRIARWNGATWSPLGSGADGTVAGLAVLPSGGLVVSGPFTSAGGLPANQVATWSAGTWQAWNLGLPPSAIRIRRVLGLPNGDLLLAGSFGIDGIVRWNGSIATQLGAGLQSSTSIWQAAASDLCTLPGGDLLVVGAFQFAGGVPANCMARWDGSAWSGVSSGMLSTSFNPENQGIRDAAGLPNGNLIAVGDFVATGPNPARNVAVWNGLGWQPIVSGAPVIASCVRVLANGDVVVGGFFNIFGGVLARGVARWDGTAWHAMGNGFAGPRVEALVQSASGEVFAAANFTSWPAGQTTLTIARWNGTTWLPLPALTGNGVLSVSRLVAQPNGGIVAAGRFSMGTTMSGLARWNGSQWQPLGQGLQNNAFPNNDVFVSDAVAMPNGDLVVCGTFDTAGGVPCATVARWNGNAWSSLAGPTNNRLVQLCALPNGDLIGSGNFGIVGTQATASVGRWNGQSWLPMGSSSGPIRRLVGLPGGDVVAVGNFDTLGSVASPYILRLTTDCPATAATYAPGCPSSSGPSLLVATLPWAGSRVRLTGSGMPVDAVVAAVTGLSTMSLPLSTVLPAPSACNLSVATDFFALSVASGGIANAEIELPDIPALSGIRLNHQMVVFELGPALQVQSTTVSNAVALIIGSI